MSSTHRFTVALVAVLSLAYPLTLATSQQVRAESNIIDAKKDQAWRIYRAYKQANSDLVSAQSRLRIVQEEARTDSQAGVSGGAHVLTAGYAKEMAALREKIAALQARMTSLDKSWDANFFGSYGPLGDSLKSAGDPKTNSKSDPIANRLNYVNPKSMKSTTLQETIPQSKPVWVLVPPSSVYKSAVDNLADYSLQEGNASRGSISAQETVTLDKTRPPEVRAGCLTWSITNKSDLDTLVPGEKLKWSATVTDTSGVGCILGNLKFEQFGMGPKFTSEGGEIFYESPPNGGTIEKHGEVAVPSGTIGDKIMLRSKVVAGRCSIVYDEIYQLKKEGAKTQNPANSVSSGSSARSDAAAESKVCGRWNSQWGPVFLESNGRDAAGRVIVKGIWEQPSKGTGTVERGTFDPTTGALEFTYFQPWNRIRGTASFSKSGDGGSMVGSFSQPPSYTGAWTLRR